jgi:hypothetical protein
LYAVLQKGLKQRASIDHFITGDFALNHKTRRFTYLLGGKTLNMQPQIGRVAQRANQRIILSTTSTAA